MNAATSGHSGDSSPSCLGCSHILRVGGHHDPLAPSDYRLALDETKTPRHAWERQTGRWGGRLKLPFAGSWGRQGSMPVIVVGSPLQGLGLGIAELCAESCRQMKLTL